jgi:serine protease Do
MTRTTQWTKFGILVASTLMLALLFAAAIDIPERGQAQQRFTSASVSLGADGAPVPASAAADWSDAFAKVAEAVKPTVVYIKAEYKAEPRATQRRMVPSPFDDFFDLPDQGRPREGAGSGFLISRDGYIMTNNHVVENTTKLTVTLYDHRKFPARVVGSDELTDIAVIKIDATALPVVSFGNSDSVRVGEWVLAIGSPLGEEFSFTVTAGIISAKGRGLYGLPTSNRQRRIQDYLQTDAAINPGNSGGPLVNARGQVIGVNAAIASQTGYNVGYGFAIPINLARTVGSELVADGKVTRAQLGISILNADPEDAAYVGLDSIRGVVVKDIPDDNSPAKRAGMEAGDVIVALDGRRVDYVAQLQQMVAFKRPGDEVAVTVQRKGGVQKTFKVRLAALNLEPRLATTTSPGEGSRGAAPYQQKLGIRVEPLTDREAAQNPQIGAERAGLIVREVNEDGPAADKLLDANNPGGTDIITHVEGQRVRTLADLNEALKTLKPGDVVSLRTFNVPRDNSEGSSRIVRIRVPQN